jgi:hypothetical protein
MAQHRRLNRHAARLLTYAHTAQGSARRRLRRPLAAGRRGVLACPQAREHDARFSDAARPTTASPATSSRSGHFFAVRTAGFVHGFVSPERGWTPPRSSPNGKGKTKPFSNKAVFLSHIPSNFCSCHMAKADNPDEHKRVKAWMEKALARCESAGIAGVQVFCPPPAHPPACALPFPRHAPRAHAAATSAA